MEGEEEGEEEEEEDQIGEDDEERLDTEEGEGDYIQPKLHPIDTNGDVTEGEDTTPRPIIDDDERADDTSTETTRTARLI